MIRHMLLAPFACAFALCGSAHAQQERVRASRTVTVHLEGDEDATLQVKDGDEWITYCRAPCNERVGADALFRVSGAGLRNSPPFELHAESGASQVVHVDSADTAGYVLGASLVVIGAIGVTTGVVLDFLGVTAQECSSPADVASGPNYGSSCDKPWHNLVDIGVGIGVASLIGIAGGVALMIADGHSSVSQLASRATRPTVAVLGLGAPARAELRPAPPTSLPRALAPSVATLPIVTVSF